MMLKASRLLAEHSPALRDVNAPLLPELKDLRAIATEMAFAIGLEAQRAALAPPSSEEHLRDRVASNQWMPDYCSHPPPSAL